ncbi:flippase-like domain-containing protein [Polynucleobacter sp. AP-Elch-400A-B2]|uniref:lysylphosphatidylglycerol synthase transmembrane domain-containing protein n=1 Tax=Polynucleobacter sp. AP-Elch-400A-B2 TaxID=2576930 RepID=UPI001BFCE0F3|nr:lysylphosphatidylglycerol synthase transmembrane domain-containing protein [Polynucleobacter sp. AP-Elch-400A-B2]QWE25001.1 flippase-like domain-containing protein [Polynucleobacter sp. AP-Elch-400A-B2]
MNRFLKLALGWGVTLYFLYLTLGKLDFHQTLLQLNEVNLNWVIFSIITLIFDYAIRIFRWWLMFRSTDFKPPLWLCGRYFLVGNALNNVLPLRAGDIYRIIQFSEKSRIPSGTVLATVAVERVYDICSLLVLLFLGISGEAGKSIFASFPLEIQQAVKILTITCLIGALAMVFAPTPIRGLIELLNRFIPIPKKLFTFLMDSLLAIQNLLSLSRAIYLVLISLFAWFLEALVYGAIQASLSLHLPINAMLISNTFATISTLFPSSPGYVGTFHYFAALSLAPFGVSPQSAASFALIMHAMLWTSICIFGLVAYLVTSKALSNLSKR